MTPESVEPTLEAIRSAIKATEYKYFGDYEFSDDQRAAVDVLVAVAEARLASTQEPATGEVERVAAIIKDRLGMTGRALDACRDTAQLILAALRTPASPFPREKVAAIVARAYGGSLCPGLGVPGDYPVADVDYRAADAIAALLQRSGEQ